MARLIYSALMSLDGYIEDQQGNFDWAAPNEEVHQFINDLERKVATYLYGRRMYETMMIWETDPSFATDSPIALDFVKIWQAAHKIVYSQTLTQVATSKTELKQELDPPAIKQLKESAQSEIAIGGASLAAQAFRAGLVDECHLFLMPVLVGGGKRALPADVHLEVELLEERRFDQGVVFLRYRVKH